MKDHGAYRKTFASGSFKHLVVSVFYTRVIYRAEYESKSCSDQNRSHSLTERLEANRKMGVSDPVVEHYQDAATYKNHQTRLEIRAFSELPEHQI